MTLTKDLFSTLSEAIKNISDTGDNQKLEDNLINASDNVFESLVGEGKRYKDPEALAKAKLEADRTIRERELELAETRKRVEDGIAMQEFLTRLQETTKSTTTQNNAGVENGKAIDQSSSNQSTNTNPPSLEEIKKLVGETLSETTKKQMQEANFSKVRDALIKEWGPNNLQEKLTKRAEELGLTREKLNDLAAESPKAFLSLVGVGEKKDSINSILPPESKFSKVSSSMKSSSSGHRTEKQWQEIKRTDPNTYFSQEARAARLRDAKALGMGYFD